MQKVQSVGSPLPRYNRSRISQFIAATASCLCLNCQAIDYGIFEARGLAMGGVAVAVGDTNQAAYYNPALLALHSGDEDKTRDGRFYFPTMVVQASDTVETAVDAADDHLDDELSNAVNAFNSQMNATTAGQVSTASKDLRDVLKKIANKDLNLEVFVGLSASEPSDHEGGAFYLGARAIGAGKSDINTKDLALLDEYIDAMDQLAAGNSLAQVAVQHPNLIDPATGRVKDPTTTLTSSADVGALAIGEWGLALAKEFTFWNQKNFAGYYTKTDARRCLPGQCKFHGQRHRQY